MYNVCVVSSPAATEPSTPTGVQDTVHRLSEDNVVEMVLKLIAQGKITLHKTTAGREWVTPKQIKYEARVETEILANPSHDSG